VALELLRRKREVDQARRVRMGMGD